MVGASPRRLGERKNEKLRTPRLYGERGKVGTGSNCAVIKRMGPKIERELDMRTLSKLALLALLALPFGSVFAQSTADINITVTITGSADITFNDGAATPTFGSVRSWTFSSALATGNASSSGVITDGNPANVLVNANGFDIKNTSGSSFAVDLTAAVSSPGNWTSGLSGALGALNIFNVQAGVGAGAFSELTTFSITNLAAGSTTGGIKLQFTTPTTVTTVHGGAITVTFTATLH